MKEITIKILASDIEETNYFDASNCAITRALNRAGYPYLHRGLSIMDPEDQKIVFNTFNSNVVKLTNKVVGMYLGSIIPKDFEFTLKKESEYEEVSN